MDPKTANLDPKLREAYDRIMGTTPPTLNANNIGQKESSPNQVQKEPLSQPVQPPLQTLNNEKPPAPPASSSEVFVQSSPKQEFIPKVEPASVNEMVQSPIFKASDPFKEPEAPPAEVLANNAVVHAEKNKGGMLKPVLFGFLGLIFFIIYALVWAKILGAF